MKSIKRRPSRAPVAKILYKPKKKSKNQKIIKNDQESDKEKEKTKENESKVEEKAKDAAEDKKKDEETENEVVNLQSIDSDSETDDEFDELNDSSSIDDQLIETNVKIEESATKNEKSSSSENDSKTTDKKHDKKETGESKDNSNEPVVNKKQFLSRNASNSSLRWTNSEILKSNDAQTMQRINLLSLFIENHAEISKILLEKTKTFGFCKLGILRIIQFTIFANDSMINQQLTNTNLIEASITVFFNYPKHNIMHHLIQDTICGILERNNETMILYLLNKTSLVDKIFKLLSKHKINQINNNLPIIPYVHLILDAFYLNKTALTWLNSSKEFSSSWKDFVTARQAFLNSIAN